MPAPAQSAKSKMTLDDIKDLIETVIAKDITEFEFQSGQEKIRICRAGANQNLTAPPPYIIVAPQQSPQGAITNSSGNPASPPSAGAASGTAERSADKAAAEKEKEAEVHMVTAPIVGTFYEASSPGAPPFVQVGDKVEAGQVLCIIEAMKLMNEIEAESGGVVTKRFVSNGQPVEYGEALFAIDTRG
jgi:acetyl-CoA carboxylase biotin carboxyl carrier protein